MTRSSRIVHGPSPAVEKARAKVEERELIKRQGTTGRVVKDVTAASGVRIDLTVLLDELADGAVEIHETLPQAWVSELLDDQKDPRWFGHGDARIDVSVEREAGLLRVEGRAKLDLQHACVRCLNDVPFDVDLNLTMRMVPRTISALEGSASAGALAGADDDNLGDSADLEDVDMAAYEGNSVDMAALMREQLFLELPMHPTCNSPRARPTAPCAFDQDRALAQEQERWVDPRWAALAALKDKLPAAPVAKPAQKPAPAVTTPPVPAKAAPQPSPAPAPAAPPAPATPAPAPHQKASQKAAKKASATSKKAAKAKKAAPKKAASKKQPAPKQPAKKAKKAAPKKKAAKKAPAKQPAKKAAKKAPKKAAKKTAKKAAKKTAQKAAPKRRR